MNVLNSSTQGASATEKPTVAFYAAFCSYWDRSSVVTLPKKVNESALHVKGTLVAGGSVRTFFRGFCLCAVGVLMQASSAQATERGGFFFRSEKGSRSASSQRKDVIAALPMKRLTPEAQQRILSVAASPTLYRRLPTQAIDCDPEMFTFLSRNAEVLVGLWELMGITSVQTQRPGPYQFEALDGTGPPCRFAAVASLFYAVPMAPLPVVVER